MNENHYFEMSVGLGAGSNNRAELLSLQLILIFAAKKGCRSLQIFGDSLNVINWVKKIQTCSDLILRNILLTIWEMVETFDLITFTHVYRENNCQADYASKEGLLLDPGSWEVKECLGDEEYAYYHRPFFEQEESR